MLQEKNKEKEEISMLIKDLNERHRKNKAISANLQFTALNNKDVFDEQVRLDHIFTEKRSKSMLKKAWGKVQGLWNGK
ncbi:hypothetical protein NEMIN01_1123 [Nematocida minor]|uniref:uncharacterized protein n=1 Tax=Nematocida minor TaxID=1912983 RepID=UPI00221EEEC8|nr:uncharacterized protein NEMIN01_1123 [Nematocida minor]KAI5190658.1 hypothetical protein NEMIN01_1123 [Nematocida minor]